MQVDHDPKTGQTVVNTLPGSRPPELGDIAAVVTDVTHGQPIGRPLMGMDSDDDFQFVRMTEGGFLNVCLCDLEYKPLGTGPLPFVELCAKHGNAAKLESLAAGGVKSLLYVQNNDGDIVPVEV